MKVLKILNLCFLCMAVSVATTKAENDTTTTTSVPQENNITTTEITTTQKKLDGEQRRFWPSPGDENFFDSTGFHFNKFPESGNNEEVVEPDPPLDPSTGPGFPFENLFTSKPSQLDPKSWLSQITNDDPYNILSKIKMSDINTPAKPGFDMAIISSSEKEDIKLLYSTAMPPIMSMTPCDNTNALTNILNNLLGILMTQMGEAPNDVNLVIDSINTSIESNPLGLSDTKLYPMLKSIQDKTSSGAFNFQNRLKRDLKSKIIFKKEIPRINEPDCKTAFLKLMALAYKSYIEASRLPDCKIKNHIIPDNPNNPNKIIIPSFDQGLTEISQDKNLYEHAYKNPLSFESANSKLIKYNIEGNSGAITYKNSTNSATYDAMNDNERDQMVNSLVANLLRSDKKKAQSSLLQNEPDQQKIEEQIDKKLLSLLSHTTPRSQPELILPTSKPATSIFGLDKTLSNLHENFPLKLSNSYNLHTSIDSLNRDSEKSQSFSNFLRSSLKQNNKQSMALRSNPESTKSVMPSSLKFDLLNSPSMKDIQVNNSKTEFLRTLKDALGNLETKVESSTEANLIDVVSNSQIFPQNKSQTQQNHDLDWLEKTLNSVTPSKVVDSQSLVNKKTLITKSSNLGLSDQHHFTLPELKSSVVKGTIPLDYHQKLDKTTKSPIDWLRLLQNAGPKRSSNNNSDTEKAQIRNNRSVALRDNAVDVNFINNQLLDALQNNFVPQDEDNFAQDVVDSSTSEPFAFNLNANAIFNSQNYRALNPRAKVAVIKDLLAQYGKSKDFKPGGNLGLLAFWHTNPNNSKVPQVIQKNNINIFITPNKRFLKPGQKPGTLDPFNPLYPYENPQNVKLLESILAYVKYLASKPNRDDENTELLNNIHSMVSQLVTNPELRQNIVVLLRVYVNWASQLGVDWTMGKNINQLLEYIKTNLVNGIDNPKPALDSQSVVQVIIKYLKDAIRKVLPNPTDQEIALNQLDHALIFAKEQGVDLTIPDNLNELLSYLKEIIVQIQTSENPTDDPESNGAPTEIPIDISILTDIAHMLKDLELSQEQRIFVIQKVRDYIKNAVQEGIELKNPENWKQLVIFVKTIVETILSKDPYNPFDPTTEPPFTIPEEFPTQDEDFAPTPPTYVINPTVLQNIYIFIENSVPNPKDKEEIFKLLESYLNTAENSGIDMNLPENLNNLIVYLNSIITQFTKTEFEIPVSPSTLPEISVNPAVIKYISQLIYSLVPDSDQRQIITAQVSVLIKSYLANGVDLANKVNLNKLIWGVVNIIKTVINGSSPNENPNSPVHQQIEPEAIEIVYKFKQKILIKGLKEPAKPQNSYVKYRVPYDVFTGNLRDLLLRTPSLRSNPDHLMKELEETTNITEVSPELQGLPKSHLIKMLTHDGSFVDAKVPTDTKRSNMRSAADLEMAVDFEQKIHDLDTIINNNTAVDTLTGNTTVTNNATDKNAVESTTILEYNDHKTAFDPLKFNANNPFYSILGKNNSTEFEDLTRKLGLV